MRDVRASPSFAKFLIATRSPRCSNRELQASVRTANELRWSQATAQPEAVLALSQRRHSLGAQFAGRDQLEWIDRWKVLTPKAGPGNSGGHVIAGHGARPAARGRSGECTPRHTSWSDRWNRRMLPTRGVLHEDQVLPIPGLTAQDEPGRAARHVLAGSRSRRGTHLDGRRAVREVRHHRDEQAYIAE